jgi:hypothetical protein
MRKAASMPRLSDLRKYDPLGAYLACQSADDDLVTLTLAEIEAILGTALPVSAAGPQFWSNFAGNHASYSWLQIGWRVAMIHRNPCVYAITFVRMPCAP